MKKLKLLVFSFIFSMAISQGQSLNQIVGVFSNGGKDLNSGNLSNFSVLGESIVSFDLSNNNIHAPIGFLAAAESGIGVFNKSIEKNNIKIFPNPFTENLFIQYNNIPKGTIIKIFNLQGENIFSLKINSDFTCVNLNHILNGLYIIRIIDNKGIILYYGKILKE